MPPSQFEAWFNFAPVMVTLMQFTVGGIVKPSLAMVLPRGRETIAKACGLDGPARSVTQS